jgi:hypothetical protein
MGKIFRRTTAFHAGNRVRPALQSVALRIAAYLSPIEFSRRLCMIAIMLISPHVQATHDPATGHYAHADYYFQTYADAQAACQASLSAWPPATCGAGTGFAKCIGHVGDGFLNTRSGDQFLHCTVTSQTCPLHASGSPCVCDAGYKFDVSGTSCVEQYTISLQIPPPAEVMPSATKSAYALVTRSDGSAKSGTQVVLSLTVVPELLGQLPSTYTGTLSANTVSIGSTIYSGETGTDGRLNFVFRAPTRGGIHTIAAGCVGCSNDETGTIKVPDCPVPPLTDISKLSELLDKTQKEADLTKALENKVNGYSLLSDETRTAERCLADRINAVVYQPDYRLTSTVRTFAYQRHLWEVWDRFWRLKDASPAIQQRCHALISEVEGEMGFRLEQDPTREGEPCDEATGRGHCIITGPAKADPKHTQNIAFDISRGTVTKFRLTLWLNQLLNSTVQQEANACGLNWGGTFTPKDSVHFVLRKP